MSSPGKPNITNWLDDLTKMVSPTGGIAHTITLVGPDGTDWGVWLAEREDIHECISGATAIIADQLPAGGAHQLRLVAVDRTGAQISVHPVSLKGRSTAAQTAASEAKVHAQTMEIHLRNMDAQSSSLRMENVRITEAHDRLLGHFSSLLEEVFTMRSRMHELEFDKEKEMRRLEMWDGMAKQMKAPLEGALGLGMEWAEHRLEQSRFELEQRKKEAAELERKAAEQRKAATLENHEKPAHSADSGTGERSETMEADAARSDNGARDRGV